MLYIYLFIFACFGVSATAFIQYFYHLYVKKQFRMQYLVRATFALFIACLCYVALLFFVD